jgi:thiol-disulfide isomerase/thioredoxin
MSRSFRFVVVALLGSAVLIFQVAMKEPPSREVVRQLGEMMHTTSEWLEQLPPDLQVDTLDGETFTLSEIIGSKLIVLNFFATWCGPCASEIPELNRYYEEHRDDGVVVIGIDVNEQEHVARAFAARHGVLYPVGLDPNGDVARNFDVEALPTTVVIGTDGRVKFHEAGAIANADIAFGSIAYLELEAVQTEPRITPEIYRAAYAEQGHPRGGPARQHETSAEMSDRALDLASRIRCPSCGEPVAACDSTAAENIKARLASMDLEGKSDGDVLVELFLVDGGGR